MLNRICPILSRLGYIAVGPLGQGILFIPQISEAIRTKGQVVASTGDRWMWLQFSWPIYVSFRV